MRHFQERKSIPPEQSPFDGRMFERQQVLRRRRRRAVRVWSILAACLMLLGAAGIAAGTVYMYGVPAIQWERMISNITLAGQAGTERVLLQAGALMQPVSENIRKIVWETAVVHAAKTAAAETIGRSAAKLSVLFVSAQEVGIRACGMIESAADSAGAMLKNPDKVCKGVSGLSEKAKVTAEAIQSGFRVTAGRTGEKLSAFLKQQGIP